MVMAAYRKFDVHFLLKADRGAPSRMSAAVQNCALLSVKCCMLGIAFNQLPALGPDELINRALSSSVEQTAEMSSVS